MHSDKTLIVQKTSAIVNCFIDSALTPSLQIDITTEMAEKIIDRRYEASPYLFREAQVLINYLFDWLITKLADAIAIVFQTHADVDALNRYSDRCQWSECVMALNVL